MQRVSCSVGVPGFLAASKASAWARLVSVLLWTGVLAIPSVAQASAPQADSGVRVRVGTPASMLLGLPQSPTPSAATPAIYTFSTTRGDKIDVNVDVYYFVDGTLAMSGDPSRLGSDFILKGTADSVYGWVVLGDREQAYEYTTGSDGAVYVQQVPVTKIYPVCSSGEPSVLDLAPAPTVIEEVDQEINDSFVEDHIRPYEDQDLFTLQSLPGAQKVLWVDIKDVMEGDTPKFYSKEKLYQAWQIYASSYSMFEVNVTTDESVYMAAGTANGGINWLDPKSGRSFCCINCFGTGKKCNTQLQSEQEYPNQYGKTISHESGHHMGLQHDGGPGGDYFGGFPDFQWSPTMGNNRCCKNWEAAVPHWSKGEYTGANQKQDDLAVITKNLPYRADDIAESRALEIAQGMIDPTLEANRGQINGNGDTDTFTFTLEQDGMVEFTVQPTEPIHGSALDVSASLLDGEGTVVAEDNPVKVRKAQFSQMLMAGSYSLVVAGGAEGTPEKGFSNYATMGFYAISGTVPYDGEAPEIEISAPDADEEFVEGQDVKVTVVATDNVGVATVELFLDDESQGKLDAKPHAWTLSEPDIGEYELHAVALDAAGNEQKSATVKFSVSPESSEDSEGGDGDGDGDSDGDGDGPAGESGAVEDSDPEDSGCGCVAGHRSPLASGMLACLAVFGVGVRTRRRQ